MELKVRHLHLGHAKGIAILRYQNKPISGVFIRLKIVDGTPPGPAFKMPNFGSIAQTSDKI